jgi:crossover junction endonuclease MUS81
MNNNFDKNYLKCIIDVREQHLINEIRNNNKYNSKYSIENFEIEQLDLGDIIYKNNERILFVIERKTMDDLASSIRDGRSKEQKYRLKKLAESGCKILILYEGKPKNNPYSGIKSTTLESSMINTLVRDGIMTRNTQSLKESAEFVSIVYNKIQKYYDIIINGGNIDYSECSVLKKKDCIDYKTCYLRQLAQIPGVSIKIAEAIAKEYSTMMILCQSYDYTDENEKINMLSDIYVGKRRIGQKVSEKIYNYICQL